MRTSKDVNQKMQEVAEQAADTLKQSGIDWIEYVTRHPIQTMVYGVVIFYAIKGMLKKCSKS